MPEDRFDQEKVTLIWHEMLTTGNSPSSTKFLTFSEFRRIMKILPKNPRCKICNAPFSGVGGTIVKLALGRERSVLNPRMCNLCDKFAHDYQGGAEVEISMLFADVRGSTTLAEGMPPLEFSRLIDRFYRAATDILIDSNAWIEKMIGDEVAGLFIPGIAGKRHASLAVRAAQAILQATGHAQANGPWLPVGVGVNTGTAYVGAVGKEGSKVEITALGDAVNTTARLASRAGRGEILVSETTWSAAELASKESETRQLQLKGRSEPVKVHVLRVTSE